MHFYKSHPYVLIFALRKEYINQVLPNSRNSAPTDIVLCTELEISAGINLMNDGVGVKSDFKYLVQ